MGGIPAAALRAQRTLAVTLRIGRFRPISDVTAAHKVKGRWRQYLRRAPTYQEAELPSSISCCRMLDSPGPGGHVWVKSVLADAQCGSRPRSGAIKC